jgi:hypothetical protein
MSEVSSVGGALVFTLCGRLNHLLKGMAALRPKPPTFYAGLRKQNLIRLANPNRLSTQ